MVGDSLCAKINTSTPVEMPLATQSLILNTVETGSDMTTQGSDRLMRSPLDTLVKS